MSDDLQSVNELYGNVSRTISIRLNPHDPIEARAMTHLNKRELKGDKPRKIIAEALSAAADRDDRQEQLLAYQREAVEILRRMESRGFRANEAESDKADTHGDLREETRAGMLKMLKPMMRIEDTEQE